MAELVPVFIKRSFSETVETGGIVLSFDSVSIVFTGDVVLPPITGSTSLPAGISVGFAGTSITIGGAYNSEVFDDIIIQYRDSRANPDVYTTLSFEQTPDVVYALTRFKPDFRSQFTITYTFTIFVSESTSQIFITQDVYNDYDIMIADFLSSIQNQDVRR
jgi:hypothetical protein